VNCPDCKRPLGGNPDECGAGYSQARTIDCLRTQLATLKAERDEMAKWLGMATRYDLDSGIVIEQVTRWQTKEPETAWIIWRRVDIAALEYLCADGRWSRRESGGAQFPVADAAFAALDKLVAAARKGG
jgi:glutathione S-transferase